MVRQRHRISQRKSNIGIILCRHTPQLGHEGSYKTKIHQEERVDIRRRPHKKNLKRSNELEKKIEETIIEYEGESTEKRWKILKDSV